MFNSHKQIQKVKQNEKTEEYLSNEGTRKIPRKNPKGNRNNWPDKEFKETIIRMLTKLETGIEEFRENFNKEKE